MLKRNKLDVIQEIKDEIKTEYLNSDTTPWIIGYSGGKDSTTVLQLVIEVLIVLSNEGVANKHVYVISSDTLVENPLVLEKTKRSIDNINQFARRENLPLSAEMIFPKSDNTFFVNLIGRGYPSPNQSFRWCTDRIKIHPANDYIFSKINENGEVILLLGTREEESVSRKRNMEKRYIAGSNLSLHSSIRNAWTYSPIAKLSVNDVWSYLLKNSCPWGDNNNELYQMYSTSSQDGECPLVIDNETKEKQSCGNSRFGCWTCTVVKEDKSLMGFIESGENWLKPLLEFRNYLFDIRDDIDKRNLFDRNGNLKKVEVTIKDDKVIIPKKNNRERYEIPLCDALTESEAHAKISSGDYDLKAAPIIVKTNSKYYRIGSSAFTIETRVEMLEKLLATEAQIRTTLPHYQIITEAEILAINDIWKRDGYNVSAVDLYNEFNTQIDVSSDNLDYQLIESICEEENFDVQTFLSIVDEALKYGHLSNRNRAVNSLNKKLSTHKLLLGSNYED